MLLLNSLAETLSQILGYISVFCWYLMSGCSLVLETQGVEVYNKERDLSNDDDQKISKQRSFFHTCI